MAFESVEEVFVKMQGMGPIFVLECLFTIYLLIC